ncbi:MAG TPA: hypothetical protein VMS43_16735 [Allosphingosinicella sp.]|nr:hypothetical protein [Allosphingosinicella sp.]
MRSNRLGLCAGKISAGAGASGANGSTVGIWPAPVGATRISWRSTASSNSSSSITGNQGFEFGRCRKCGRDLVRSGRAWRTIPPGFRVVWRGDPPGAAVTSAAQLKLKLDLDLPERRLPAAPERPQSRLAAGLDLALLGLRGLAAMIADRARLWSQARPARRIAIAGALAPPER